MIPGLGPDSDDDIFDKDFVPPSGARVIASGNSDGTRSSGGQHSAPSRQDHALGTVSSWNSALGWSVYFPDELELDKACEGRAKAVRTLKQFFLSEPGQQMLTSLPRGSSALPLDYQQISHRSSAPVLRGIANAIETSPESSLASIGLAACRAAEQLAKSNPEKATSLNSALSRENRIWPRIYNFAPVTAMKSLRGNSVGRFVSVKGTVVRVSNIRQQLTSMEFECTRCGEKQLRSFTDYKYSVPTKCPTEKCRARTFNPLQETADTVDWQKIRVQELQDKNDDLSFREEGRMPRTIDAELFSDLLDSCIPGDTVTVCGTIRVLTIEGARQRGSANSLYYMYLEANSVSTNRNRNSSAVASAMPIGRHLEEAETRAIHGVVREVVREEDPFGFLVHSAIPSIYGHELVKAGLLLSLFGGAPKDNMGPSTSEAVSIRRDIHCLVVGDPGLGKSQMLKAICNIAPRGVYVCGNTTTTAGLTVTVVREASGDFALEAGALVLGDRGICCIDEFDKMGAEHGALLEAMEQQSVSVAKAGLLCNLSARTTVVAAANPVGGHYDRSRTVCENLKIALPLLSRFDLVFILMDKSDAERDQLISKHVMRTFGMRCTDRAVGQAWREGERRAGRPRHSSSSSDSTTADDGSGESGEREQEPLRKRLRRMRVSDPLPPRLFRQYISYAKEHVKPELSEGAKRELQEFYLRLRRSAQEQGVDTTPITTRQLESLIRLSEARARAVMRTVVTRQDAREVIEIMQEAMVEELTDEGGVVDLGRASGMSRSKDARLFVKALHAEARRCRKGVFDKRELRQVAERIGVAGERFENVLETVNYQGFLTKKGVRKWELQGCEFGDDSGGSGNQGKSQYSMERRRSWAMRRGHGAGRRMGASDDEFDE